jgi:Holliday junction DNA helicase RuvB
MSNEKEHHDRIVSPESQGAEDEFNWGLRPKNLGEYIGQEEVARRLGIAIKAAKKRGEPLDHLLLHGPPGLGKCITPDSLVLTGDGLKEFSELIPVGLQPQESTPAKVEVFGLHGLERASDIYRSGRVPTLRLKTRGGFEIEGTPHHPLLVATPQGARWKKLEEIATGDFVALARGSEIWGQALFVDYTPDAPRHRRARSEAVVRSLHGVLQNQLNRAPSCAELRRAYSVACGTGSTPTAETTAHRLGLALSDGRTLPRSMEKRKAQSPFGHHQFSAPPNEKRRIALDADFGYLLGAFVGDGHLEKGANFPAFIITCEEAAMQDELVRVSQNVFGVTPQARKYGDKAARIRFSQNIGKACLQAGLKAAGAAGKTVPTKILCGPREAVIGFLQGLFDADGHARQDGIEWGSRSEKLSWQVQLLLLNLGIVSHRRKAQKSGAPFWSLFIGGRAAATFCEQIGFRLARKQSVLQESTPGWQRSDFVPYAAPLLCALLDATKPHSRATHRAFDHAKRGDREFTRAQIEKLLALLPPAFRALPEHAVLQELVNLRLTWDRVESLENREAEAYDFVVPGTHSFVANGFYNHNTTLAYIIAEEMGREISLTSGPALESPKDVMPYLVNASEGDIIFIDEIHRVPRAVEEFLYSAMEDYVVTITLDKGMYSKPLPFKLQRFTLIGATTRPAMLTRPLRDRFGIQQHFDFYNESDLVKIAHRSARILETEIEDPGAHSLARRARGTPRVVNRLLARVRDFAQVMADGTISEQVASDALRIEGIDELGLDRLDRALLRVMKEIYSGGPVGIEALAATLNEETDTLVDVVEPYLLKIGFIARTPQGRRLTRQAYEYLGEAPPASAVSWQPSLLDEAQDATERLREQESRNR